MDYRVCRNINPTIYEDICEIIDCSLPWIAFRKKTILITGASGFIGSYLALTLLELNDRFNLDLHVVALIRNKKKGLDKYGVLLKRADFEIVIQDICQEISYCQSVDYIIHAASQASAEYFENDPVGTINANLIGTINVLEFARHQEAPEILFVSSLKVYGTVSDGAQSLHEEVAGYLNLLSYKNCYAEGKRAGEMLCQCYAKQYGLDVKIARPCYIYGASTLEDDRVWAQFIANIVYRQNILLKSSGAAYRSFCYVSDAVAALFTILLKGVGGTPYNISEHQSNITIRKMAQIAVSCFPERMLSLSYANKEDEKMPELRFENTPEILDNRKIKQLGWTGKVSIEEGIKRAVLILENAENIGEG